ncbi:MAG: hypothetical protein FJZ12_03290 [Candidatus Omnitrophica bacterium]|nr:hypothetical protein [Candidatus Omnitrophota bacterium]
MYKKINNPRSPEIFSALREVSKTPVDLYFGADINNRAYLFAFWLIFGGIKRNGEVSFWPYESKEIIKHILSKIGFKFPEFIDADILNFGLDINDRNIYYKLYYLYKKKEHGEFYYSGLISKLDKGLKNNDYFYFFSKMYDKEGRCKKIKLFIEFLSDINFFGTKFGKILKKVLEINKSRVKPNQLIEIFKLIKRGRISLIGFEPDKTITFYIRFD